jgi:hypothetical protein
MYVVELLRREWVYGPLLGSILACAALGPRGLLLVLLALVVPLVASRSRRVRRAIDEAVRHRAYLAHRDLREARVEDAHAGAGELREMTALVDGIRSLAPDQAEWLELEHLLDRVADTLVARARWRRAEIHDRTRSRLHERRLAFAARGRDRVRELDEDLAAARELLACIAARTAVRVTGARTNLEQLAR